MYDWWCWMVLGYLPIDVTNQTEHAKTEPPVEMEAQFVDAVVFGLHPRKCGLGPILARHSHCHRNVNKILFVSSRTMEGLDGPTSFCPQLLIWHLVENPSLCTNVSNCIYNLSFYCLTWRQNLIVHVSLHVFVLQHVPTQEEKDGKKMEKNGK